MTITASTIIFSALRIIGDENNGCSLMQNEYNKCLRCLNSAVDSLILISTKKIEETL